jgi:ribosomal protein S27AE
LKEEHYESRQCPQCGQNFLSVIEDDLTIRGACQSCGYQFSNWKENSNQESPPNPQPQVQQRPLQQPLKQAPTQERKRKISVVENEAPPVVSAPSSYTWSLNKFAGIIGLIAVIISVVSIIFMSGLIGGIQDKVDDVRIEAESDISSLNTKITSIDTSSQANMSLQSRSIDILNHDIDTLTTDVNLLKSDIGKLITNDTTFTTRMNESLNNITNQVQLLNAYFLSVNSTNDTAVNLSVSYSAVSNNSTIDRYGKIELTITHSGSNIAEMKVRLQYDNLSFSNVSWNTKSIPEVYTHVNPYTYYDNVRLEWLGVTESTVKVTMDISWNLLLYNSSTLDITKLSRVLVIDGLPIEIKNSDMHVL